MAIKISGSTIIDDSRVILNSDKIGIGITSPDRDLDILSNVALVSDFPSAGIGISANTTLTSNTPKAFQVFNNSSTTQVAISYTGRIDANEYFGTFKGTIDSGVAVNNANKLKVTTSSSNSEFTIPFVDSSATTGSYQDFFIDSDVATALRFNASTGHFQVNGTGKDLLSIRTTANASNRGIAFQNSGNAYAAIINAENQGNDSVDLVFHVDDSNNADPDLVEERMRLTKEGNLGIGDATTNPTEKLHVHTASGEAVIMVQGATDSKLRLTAINGDSIIQFGDSVSDQAGFFQYDHGTDDLIYNRDGEKLRITSTGDVGIGSDSTGGARLRVYQDGTDTLLQQWRGSLGSTAGERAFNLYSPATDTTSDYYRFQTGNAIKFQIDSIDALCIDDGGEVGIGTDSPEAKLDVYANNASAGGILQITQDGTGDAAIDFQLKGTREYTLGIDNSDSDKFKLSGSAGLDSDTLLTVTNDGLVGVNYSTPRGLVDIRSHGSSDPYIPLYVTAQAAATSGANSGLTTVMLESNNAKRPELRLNNIHNGNWHESNGNTQHWRILWTASNENSQTPETAELKPTVVNNAGGAFSYFRIRVTDTVNGLADNIRLRHTYQQFYINGSKTLENTTTGLGITESLYHIGDTDTLMQFEDNTINFDTAGSERLQINSTGNVLPGANGTQNLGSSSKRWNILYANDVDISGDISLSGDINADDLYVSGIATFANDIHVADAIIHLGDTDTQINFGTNEIKFDTAASERLRITSNGAIQLSGGANGHLQIDDNGEFEIFESDTSLSMNNSSKIAMDFASNVARLRSSTNGTATIRPLGFFMGAVEKVRITPDGDVGIGTTNPNALLGVNVGSSVTAFNIEGTEGQLFSVTNNLSSGSIFAVNDISGTPSINVDADGTISLAPFLASDKIGIGTTNPTNKLDVIGDVFVSSKVGINSTSPREKLDVAAGRIILDEGYQLTWANGTTNRARIHGDSGSNFIIETGSSNAEVLRAKSDGNVHIGGKLGIGVNAGSPSYQLQIHESVNTAYAANATIAQLAVGNVNSSSATNAAGIHLFTDGNGRGVVNLSALNNSTNASADFVIQTRHNSTLAERLRITSDGFVGINEELVVNGLTINKSGDYSHSDGNTYYQPVGKWLSAWGQANLDDGEDHWVGFTGKYGNSSASVNISLAPNFNNTSQQAGMYIAGEAIDSGNSDFTVGKIVSGSATGKGTSGNVRATKSELFRIARTGNVGIGSTIPTEALDVAGNVVITGTINASSFVGPVTGSASQITVTDETTDTTCFPVFVENAASADQEPHTSTSFEYNSSSKVLISQIFQASDGNSPNVASRDKYRLWNNNAYAIGFDNGMTFGGLNDYATTFQMNNQNNRGWVFLDNAHSDAQGAMSLTTNGKMALAHSLRLGYGESDTTTPGATYRLDVSGDAAINSTNNQALYLNNTNTNGQTSIAFQSAGSTKFIIGSNKDSNSDPDFFIFDDTNDKHRFNITKDGFVGINTDNPGVTFDVHGTSQVRDASGNQNFIVSDSLFTVSQSVSNWNNLDYDSSPILAWDYKNPTGDMMYMASGGNTAIASQMALVISDGHGFKVGKSGYDGTDYDVDSSNEYLRITTSGSVNIGGDYTQTTRELKVTGDAEVTGTLYANISGSITPTGNVTITGNLQVDGNTTLGNATSDTLTVNASPTIINDDGLVIVTDSNAPTNGAQIKFSDNQSQNYIQQGHIRYKHPDNSVAPGSNDGFIIGGTENLTIVKVEGRVLVDEKVGIGTNTASDILHIHSSAPGIRLSDSGNVGDNNPNPSPYAFAYFDANAANAIIHADKGNDVADSRVAFAVDNSEKMRIESDGKVGIGTVDPQHQLDVFQFTNTNNSNTGTTLLRLNNHVGSSANNGDILGLNGQRSYIDFRFVDTNVNFIPQVRIGAQVGETSGADGGIPNEGSGSFVVYTSKGSGSAGAGTISEKFRVDPDGNVGIIQAVPNAKLHIGPLQGDTTPHVYLASGNNNWGAVIDTQDYGAGNVPLRISLRNSGTDTEKVRITQAGLVGIGTTNPTATLHIHDTDTTGPVLHLRGGSDSEGDLTVEAGEQLQTGHWDGSTFTERLRLTDSGTINIGGDYTQTNRMVKITGDAEVTGTLYANISGNITGAADEIKTQSRSTNADHYVTFVDSNNNSASAESLYTDAGIKYNPSTNNLTIDGDMTVGGVLTYEDVTNVDSIGIITARAGADIKGALLDVQSGIIHLSKQGAANRIEIGTGQNANNYAYVDLVGDSTYTDYGLRLLRGNTGENADSNLFHRGTGDLLIKTIDEGAIKLKTDNSTSNGITITSNGKVGVNNNSPQQALQVDGFIYLGPNNTSSFVHGGASVTYSADSSIYFVADANDTDGVAPSGEFIWGGGSNTNTDSNRDFTAAEFGNGGKPRNEYLILDENSLRPASNNGLDLGTSSLKFNEIFATTVTADSITGTLASPGSDTQVLFNDGGTNVGADAGLTFNKTTDKLTVGGDIKLGGTLIFDDTSGGVEKIDIDGGNLDLHADGLIRFFESDNDNLMFTFDVNTTNGDARIILENDTDTYFNHPAGNQLGFTAGNQEVMRIQSTALNLKKDVRYGASDSALRTSHIYVRGTGLNNSNNRICTINGVDQISGANSSNIGLHLLIFDADDSLTLDSGTTYNTHSGGTTVVNNLATAIGNMDRTKIGVLVSWDAFTDDLNDTLRTAAQKVGLFKLAGMGAGTQTRQPYAAIFRGTSDDTNAEISDAIEVVQSNDADAPSATISTFITVQGDGENASITGAYSVSAIVAPAGTFETPVLQAKSSTDSASTLNIRAGVHLLPSGSASNGTDTNGVDLGGGSNYLRQIYVRQLNADSIVGTVSGSASQVTLADDTSDVDGYITFSNGATGNQSIKTNANLRYDAADGILEVIKTDGGIKFGPGTAANDDAHIEWKGGSNAGYLRISTSDDSDSAGTNEYIEIGDYASQNRGGTFTQHVRIARNEFLVRTGSNTIATSDRLKIDENGRSLFTGDVTEVLRLSQDVDAATQQEFGIGFAANATHTHPAAQITYKEFDASDSRGSLLFYTRNSNSDAAPDERLRITNDGKVGINEPSPDSQLVVRAITDDNPSIKIYRNSGGGDVGTLAWGSSTGVNARINWRGGGGNLGLQFHTSDNGNDGTVTEKLRITSTGQVNIGGDYAQTSKRLKVTGDGEFTGNLTVGGQLTYQDVTNIESVGIITAPAFRATGATFINSTGTESDPTNVAFMMEKGDYIYTFDGTSAKRRLIGKSSNEIIEIGQSGTALIDEIRMSPGNAGKFTVYNDTTKKFEITNEGMVRIGESSPIVVDATNEEAVYLKADLRDANADTVYGMRLDIDDDNTGTATSDRERGSIYLDFDGLNYGGDTSNELRVYNIWNDVDINADNDIVRGIYNDVNINYSTGQTSQAVGTYNLPRITNASTVSNIYGMYNDVYRYGANCTGSTSGMYGAFVVSRNINGATGSVTSMYGIRAECRISDGNSGGTSPNLNANTNVNVSNAYAVYARMENDNYTNTNMGTSGTTALFYGTYGGDGGTNGLNNPYGLYITSAAPDNFIGGNLEVDGNLVINGTITGDTGVANIAVSYTGRSGSCSTPITVTGTTTKTINIPTTSNADGHKYVQTTEPTGSSVCDGDVWYDTSSSGTGGGVTLANATDTSYRNITFADNSSATVLKINDAGKLQVRPSDGNLKVEGDVIAFSTSDITLKKNISPIKNALKKVKSLSGNTFEWNEKSRNKGKDVGVIAQEVEKLDLPGVTTTRQDGTKAVRYEKLVPLLIEAIKELKDEINEMKANASVS